MTGIIRVHPRWIVVIALCASWALGGCGDGGENSRSADGIKSPLPATPAKGKKVAISVTPTTASVFVNEPNRTRQFTATITGCNNCTAAWDVVEANCGTVNGTGLYTPPTTVSQWGASQNCTVRATLVQDSSKSSAAAVSVSARQLSGGTVDWQWQMSGSPYPDFSVDAGTWLLGLSETPDAGFATLFAANKYAICAFQGGKWEASRPDVGCASSASDPRCLYGTLPADSAWYLAHKADGTLGDAVPGAPSEYFWDIRSAAVREVMEDRIDLARARGCQAVVPLDVDTYLSASGFSPALGAGDQLSFNLQLSAYAHGQGLAIGLANDLPQVSASVDGGVLHAQFDFAVNEECLAQGTCSMLLPFVQSGKAVLQAEYSHANDPLTCDREPAGHSMILKNAWLDAWRFTCVPTVSAGAIVIDHTCTDATKIPAQYIEAAKNHQLQMLAVRSHGGQVWQGALAYAAAYPAFEYHDWYLTCSSYYFEHPDLADGGTSHGLRSIRPSAVQNFNYPFIYWADNHPLSPNDGGTALQRMETTVNACSGHDYTLSTWAWSYETDSYFNNEPGPKGDYPCHDTDCSLLTQAWFEDYVQQMEEFENRWPNIAFVFQTRYLDADTRGEALNDIIRAHIAADGGILFDVADIERYGADGTDFGAWDDGEWGGYALDGGTPVSGGWCDLHPADCALAMPSECTHVDDTVRPTDQFYSCKLKAQAWWWLLARLEGWDGKP